MNKMTLRTASLAGVWLVPLAAIAAADDGGYDKAEAPADTQAYHRFNGEDASRYDNYVEIGAVYGSSSSPLANRYTGGRQGGIGIGSFTLGSPAGQWSSR